MTNLFTQTNIAVCLLTRLGVTRELLSAASVRELLIKVCVLHQTCRAATWPGAVILGSRGGKRKMSHVENGAFTVLVEGNIGSGKTTFLEHFRRFEDVTLITEPVEKWRDLRGFNLLELMYSEPARWAMAFQTYVSVTMAEAHVRHVPTPVKLMERSLYSARYCFVENMVRAGTLHPAHHAVLDEWFQFMCRQLPVRADLIVYLKTSPEVAHERIRRRARSEEQCVPLTYLQQLHHLHESWLVERTLFHCPAPVLVLDADLELSRMGSEYERSEHQILRKAVEVVINSPNKLSPKKAITGSPIKLHPRLTL